MSDKIASRFCMTTDRIVSFALNLEGDAYFSGGEGKAGRESGVVDMAAADVDGRGEVEVVVETDS